ncbi:hypothetical protein THRCLA_20792 [Thraustotheca clavata]|uniref:Uncharacterized protein n=1 Tax=Thraustotheca clavata TaxID=74557 RepID=A0A1W0A3I5_9STRA|nr:hypothetical protein THRCLA_20792 [Thraustotheca clavata]
MIRCYLQDIMNEHVDILLPWISAAIWALRLLTLQQLIDIFLKRNKSSEARFKENKAKLVAFFKVHDPVRISEASALLNEYLGNESLLFVKLKSIYTKPSRVVLKSE